MKTFSKTLLYFSGGYDGAQDIAPDDGAWYLDTVLRFDPASLSWVEVGRLSLARAWHALAVVEAEDVKLIE